MITRKLRGALRTAHDIMKVLEDWESDPLHLIIVVQKPLGCLSGFGLWLRAASPSAVAPIQHRREVCPNRDRSRHPVRGSMTLSQLPRRCLEQLGVRYRY